MNQLIKKILSFRNNKLFKSGSSSVFLKGIYIVTKILLAVILARLLGAHDYGVYSYALAIIMTLIIPAKSGVPTLLTREIAKYKAKKDWGLLKGLILRSNQFILFTAFLLILFGIIIGSFFLSTYSDLQREVFFWSLLLIPFLALTSIQCGSLKGLQEIFWGLLPERAVLPLFFLISVLLFYWLNEFSIDPVSVIILYIVVACIALGISGYKLFTSIPSEVKKTVAQFSHKAWINSIIPLTLLGGIGVINTQADTIILGVFESAETVGQYRIAVKGAGLVTFLLGAVNTVLSPKISELFAKNKIERLQNLITRTARLITFTAVVIFLVYALFGRTILDFIFGVDYIPSYYPLIILSIGHLANAFFGSVGIILNMTGNERDTAFGAGIAAASNIVLNFLFIPMWGFTGAASATMLTTILWNVILYFKLKNKLGIISIPFNYKNEEA